NQSDAVLMNYQWFKADGFLRDPERPAVNAQAPPYNIIGTSSPAYRTDPSQLRPAYTGGFNVPYTYPDHNNFYLAHMDPTTGQITMPSFHREYIFGRLDDASNPNWTNAIGKYLT